MNWFPTFLTVVLLPELMSYLAHSRPPSWADVLPSPQSSYFLSWRTTWSTVVLLPELMSYLADSCPFSWADILAISQLSFSQHWSPIWVTVVFFLKLMSQLANIFVFFPEILSYLAHSGPFSYIEFRPGAQSSSFQNWCPSLLTVVPFLKILS